jgi:peptidoglycan-associated lipoprotein
MEVAMKKQAYMVTMILCAGLSSLYGCAKRSVVKSDTPSGAMQTVSNKNGIGLKKDNSLKLQKLSLGVGNSVATNDRSGAGKNPDAGTESETRVEPIANAAELRMALERIYFEFDSSLLSNDARRVLKSNAEKLKHNTKAVIKIEGHCDERGSDEYNLALGERRARTSMKYLEMLGIPERQLSIVSYGEERPADPGHDETAWAKNRRDEFVIVGNQSGI